MDIYNLIYAFFNSPGPGGVVVLLVYSGACVIYFLLTRWILAGGAEHSKDTPPPDGSTGPGA